ncbi:PREDICTED: uncharacterized protein LOC106809991 [Priapulus caudatus]|uniref:Uncharacterized protein LOC106809991 n=1 Tax=Priapulus caudatus TaxID=37621 RepID=A0ABM1E958_PRICU|nr:PREDICTED: uncharacterized protein LOC106809991 [Priapulus caudatus]
MDIEQLERLHDAEQKFDKACQQIIVLDQQIRDLETLYKRAVKSKKNAFRYNLRLKLSVITGVKMMYHHYAGTQAEEINRARHSLGGYFENNNDSESDNADVIHEDQDGEENYPSTSSASTSASSSSTQREQRNSTSSTRMDVEDSVVNYSASGSQHESTAMTPSDASSDSEAS